MSHSVHERLRLLETDVQHLQVLPAAAVRARGRRRGRRQMAGVVVGVAVVATTAGVTATNVLDRPEQGLTPAGPAVVSLAADCDLSLPSDPAGVRVRVLNGATATALRERGFTVLTHTDGAGTEPSGPTTLTYGPATIGRATVLRAALIGDTTMRFDPARSGDTIDLTLGTTFDRLATSTELNQALVAVGEPSAPPEC
jgi:hypothetical protein